MLTSDIRSQIDAIWNAFWSGGISNPMEVLEQITYLLFIRRLDDAHTLEESKALMLKRPMLNRVFPEGKDVKGPSAAANSVAKLDHFIASNGTLYNQKFLPSALAGDSGLQNFASLVRSYFDHKGMHVQFNVVNRQLLLDAQREPEKYRDLVVRVAGYSAQFTILAKEVQDDIIRRTEQVF